MDGWYGPLRRRQNNTKKNCIKEQQNMYMDSELHKCAFLCSNVIVLVVYILTVF